MVEGPPLKEATNGRRRGSVARFILRGGALAVTARLLVVGCGFAVQVLLARLLPPEELGAYFLVQSVVIVVATLSQAGLSRPLTRELARLVGGDALGGARNLLFVGLCLSALPVALVTVLYAGGAGSWLATAVFSSPVMSGASVAAAGWLAGLAFQNLGSSAIRGFHRVGAAAYLGGALTNLLLVAALAWVLWTVGESDFLEVVWIAAGATWINVAVCVVVLGHSVRGARSESAVSARVLLASAAPLILSQVARVGFTQADLWMVGGFLSDEQVALYGAAKRMARLVAVPLVTMNMVVPPLVADLYARREPERLQRAVRGAATLAAIPSIAFLIPLIVFSAPVLGLIFGDFFSEGATLLRLLSIERLAFVWVGPCVAVLIMTGHERDVLALLLVGGAVSIAAIYLGGLLAGTIGVATGFAMSGALREGLTAWVTARRVGIRTDVDFLHIRPMKEAVQRAFRR